VTTKTPRPFIIMKHFIVAVASIVILGASVRYSTASIGLFLPIYCYSYYETHRSYWTGVACLIVSLRYTRLLGHIISSWAYKPSAEQENPLYRRGDVSVILPTIDPNGPDFEECVRTILENQPAELMVVTVGQRLLGECKRVLRGMQHYSRHTEVTVSSLPIASKRRQVAHAMPHVKHAITVLADDHVFWPSKNFLPSLLAPFESPRVGVVATKKRVRRTTPGNLGWASAINFVACNYLQRHNWELRASNAIDGGLFVVSGRTAAYRTRLLQNPGLMARFCNEKFFFGLFGGGMGLGPDDDNFLTREIMKMGQEIKFQDTADATIETTLGEWPKFRGQLIRWARTTFRSNPVMLRDAKFLRTYTWSYFMVYVVGMLNFALLWDGLLVFSVWKSSPLDTEKQLLLRVAAFIFWTKTVKLWPHFLRHPFDLLLMPYQVIFAYLHSILKLWALLTFWDCDWSGRKLEAVNDNGEATGFEPISLLK
jgi:hypothetical protein